MTIIETLQRAIFAGERAGATLTELTVSDAAAWELAGELALMQPTPLQSASDIYEGMKAGNSKFMDRKVIVAEKGETTA